MAGLSFYLMSIFRGRRPNHLNLPIPKVCHRVLSVTDIRDRPVFIIGDVHGCRSELDELISKAKQLHEDILYIFVGDLVNKGPDSKGVLDLVAKLDHHTVRGNHDESVLQHGLKLQSGDVPTWYEWVKTLSQEHIDYLTDLPYTIEMPSLNAIIVHAGLIPDVSLANQDLRDMTHMRNLALKSSLFGKRFVAVEIGDGVPWASKWSGPEHVYFGHDARRGLQTHPFATGLDTGCLYGKCLTGMFLNRCKTVIQVQAKDMYVVPGSRKT